MNDTGVKPTPSLQIATAAECIPLCYSMNQYDEIGRKYFIIYIASGKKGDAGKEYQNG